MTDFREDHYAGYPGDEPSLLCGTPVRLAGTPGFVLRLRGPVPAGFTWVRLAGVDAPVMARTGSLKVTGKPKSAMTRRVASVSSFTRLASDGLVRSADNDFWNLRKCEDGSFLIERLFDDDGNPLKEGP